MDHLLVMPIIPFEIAMSKIWSNGLVITFAVGLSLIVVVRGLLGVPIEGSIFLFMAGVVIYLFFATAIGIFLGTVARSMPQLGLLFILVAIPLNMLSGSNTPIESMPTLLRTVMQASPSTHFVSFAQAILYRGAGFDLVWPQFLDDSFGRRAILGPCPSPVSACIKLGMKTICSGAQNGEHHESRRGHDTKCRVNKSGRFGCRNGETDARQQDQWIARR